jgi:hypothetical protein
MYIQCTHPPGLRPIQVMKVLGLVRMLIQGNEFVVFMVLNYRRCYLEMSLAHFYSFFL